MTSTADPFATLPPDRSPNPTPSRGKGTGSRWATFNRFVDFIARDLTPIAGLVWFCLFRDTKRDGLATASETNLADRTGRSVRTVRAGVVELIDRGLIVRVRKGTPGRASVYRVVVEGKRHRKKSAGQDRQ